MTQEILNKDSKWRGIPTNPQRRKENKPHTIINRLGQKSISLPRIDDKKRLAGFAGLAGTAKKISKMIDPNFKVYVELFAGSGKVWQEIVKRKDLKIETFILNDTSNFVISWLKKEFPEATITQMDFVDCLKFYDSDETIFLIDGPWFKGFYKQPFTTFNRKSVREYDEQIISLCTGKPFGDFNKEGYKIKGKFLITSRKENRVFLKSKFTKRLVKSEYVISGKYPRVMLTTNLDLKGKRI